MEHFISSRQATFGNDIIRGRNGCTDSGADLGSFEACVRETLQ